MTRIANPFRYQFRAAHPSTMCVYRLWFGKKYLIIKCKALHQSVNQAAKEIDQRLRLGPKEGIDFYRKAIAYIKHARVTMMEVEVLCAPETPLELLKCETKAAHAGKRDEENCLNGYPYETHFPKWIPQTDIDAYNLWFEKTFTRPYKPKAKAKNTKDGHNRDGRRKATVPTGRRKHSHVRPVQKKIRPK